MDRGVRTERGKQEKERRYMDGRRGKKRGGGGKKEETRGGERGGTECEGGRRGVNKGQFLFCFC